MRKGFTLIEVLVAVTIIAVLVSIGVVSYGSVNKRSRDAKRKGDVEQMRSALEMYRADYGSYPDPSGSLAWTDASGLSATLVSTYVPAIPSDPLSTQTYRYRAINLYSYCIGANLESEASITGTCNPETGYNYGAKNP